MNKLKAHQAYSLIFSFILMTGIMLVAATTIENTREKVKFFNGIEGTIQARIAAESGVDRALALLKDGSFGYEPADDPAGCDPVRMSENPENEDCSTFEVHALGDYRPNDSTGSFGFSVPIYNTGNAGDIDECEKKNTNLDDPFDPNHPCHWNKITLGETITVPLFASVDSQPSMAAICGTDPGATCNPSEVGITTFRFIFRTPCRIDLHDSYSSECDGSDRYQLDTDGTLATDQAIIFWELIGYEDDDNDPATEPILVNLLPDDGYDTFPVRQRNSENTEIYESLINQWLTIPPANTIMVRNGSSSPSAFNELYDFMMNPNLEELYLNITLINPLVSSNPVGEYVPYLEWRINSQGGTDGRFADNKVVITSEGYFKNQSGIFYYPIEIWRSTIDTVNSPFTVSN